MSLRHERHTTNKLRRSVPPRCAKLHHVRGPTQSLSLEQSLSVPLTVLVKNNSSITVDYIHFSVHSI